MTRRQEHENLRLKLNRYCAMNSQCANALQVVMQTRRLAGVEAHSKGKALFYLRFLKLSMAPGIRYRTGFPSLQHFQQRGGRSQDPDRSVSVQ